MPHDAAIAEARTDAILTRLDLLWDELFPAVQVRIVKLLVERVGIGADHLNVRVRTAGLGALAREMAPGVEATAQSRRIHAPRQ